MIHRAEKLAFRGSVLLVLLAHVGLVVVGFVLTRLWEDEAYNLTVPVNLARGLGYVSDGILTTGALDPFDFRISTGPVTLLPIGAVLATGVDPVLGARLVMAVFWATLVTALWLVGMRVGGRWGALVAVTFPLVLDTIRVVSPIQGPTDVLGEIPAATLIAVALLCSARHPALAGLALGLAIQSKNLAVVVVPVFLLAQILLTGSSLRTRMVRGLQMALMTAVPTIVFEIVKLTALGPSRYAEELRLYIGFLRTGGQVGFGVGPGTKLRALADAWFLPGPLVPVLVVLVIAAAFLGLRRLRPNWSTLTRPAGLMTATAAGGLAVWLLWWVASSGLPAWIRHPSPALLALGPVCAAASARLAAAALVRPSVRRTAAVVTGLVAATQIALHLVVVYTPGETLEDQRQIAAPLSEIDAPALYGWWGALPSLAVLAEKKAVLIDDGEEVPGPVVVDLSDQPAATERVTTYCGRATFQVRHFLVCEGGSSP